MYALRARFKKEIVAEFLPPSRRADWRRGRVIIFCSGMPSVPAKGALLKFWSCQGYWVFYPRYRGTWESGGRFLKHSPEKDILDVIDGIGRGFRDLWSGKIYRPRPQKVFIIGGSFGGAAAILASRDKRVDRVIGISPVIDWRAPMKSEPIDKMEKFLRNGFGGAFRYSRKDFLKLAGGSFYNPMALADKIDGGKVFIIHAKDDKIVGWPPAEKFAKLTGAKLWLLKNGGHLSLNVAMKPRFYKKIIKFLKQ